MKANLTATDWWDDVPVLGVQIVTVRGRDIAEPLNLKGTEVYIDGVIYRVTGVVAAKIRRPWPDGRDFVIMVSKTRGPV